MIQCPLIDMDLIIHMDFFYQKNLPGNLSAEEERFLDRLVTIGKRKGLHLSKDKQEVIKF